jgi:hypothetical protein
VIQSDVFAHQYAAALSVPGPLQRCLQHRTHVSWQRYS